jgi:hypothetical protein
MTTLQAHPRMHLHGRLPKVAHKVPAERGSGHVAGEAELVKADRSAHVVSQEPERPKHDESPVPTCPQGERSLHEEIECKRKYERFHPHLRWDTRERFRIEEGVERVPDLPAAYGCVSGHLELVKERRDVR